MTYTTKRSQVELALLHLEIALASCTHLLGNLYVCQVITAFNSKFLICLHVSTNSLISQPFPFYSSLKLFPHIVDFCYGSTPHLELIFDSVTITLKKKKKATQNLVTLNSEKESLTSYDCFRLPTQSVLWFSPRITPETANIRELAWVGGFITLASYTHLFIQAVC